MAEIAKSAGVSDVRDRYLGISSIELKPRTLQAHLPEKRHGRVAAALLEGMEQTARTRAGDGGKNFDRERLVPALLRCILRLS